MDEAVPMTALTLIGLYCLVRAVLAWPSNLLASLAPVGLVLVGCVGFLVWAVYAGAKQKNGRQGSTAYSIAKMHRSGWSMSHVKRHELGHYRVARALGCRAKIDLDRGATYVEDDHCTPVEKAAISYGGWAAAGDNGGDCKHDFADIDQYLRQVPWSQRSRARAEAKRIARRYA